MNANAIVKHIREMKDTPDDHHVLQGMLKGYRVIKSAVDSSEKTKNSTTIKDSEKVIKEAIQTKAEQSNYFAMDIVHYSQANSHDGSIPTILEEIGGKVGCYVKMYKTKPIERTKLSSTQILETLQKLPTSQKSDTPLNTLKTKLEDNIGKQAGGQAKEFFTTEQTFLKQLIVLKAFLDSQTLMTQSPNRKVSELKVKILGIIGKDLDVLIADSQKIADLYKTNDTPEDCIKKMAEVYTSEDFHGYYAALAHFSSKYEELLKLLETCKDDAEKEWMVQTKKKFSSSLDIEAILGTLFQRGPRHKLFAEGIGTEIEKSRSLLDTYIRKEYPTAVTTAELQGTLDQNREKSAPHGHEGSNIPSQSVDPALLEIRKSLSQLQVVYAQVKSATKDSMTAFNSLLPVKSTTKKKT